MGKLKRRRLRRHIKSMNLPIFRLNHGVTGEYQALCWLKSYVEGTAASEPLELVKSIVLHSPNGINSRDRLYILTLLEWC